MTGTNPRSENIFFAGCCRGCPCSLCRDHRETKRVFPSLPNNQQQRVENCFCPPIPKESSLSTRARQRGLHLLFSASVLPPQRARTHPLRERKITARPMQHPSRTFAATPFAASAMEGGKRRATLSDTENLAVGAFGGVLETVIQSECVGHCCIPSAVDHFHTPQTAPPISLNPSIRAVYRVGSTFYFFSFYPIR